jgi:hypothetical protein
MTVKTFDNDSKNVVLVGQGTRLSIIRRIAMGRKDGWYLDWTIEHNHEEKSAGRRILSDSDLNQLLATASSLVDIPGKGVRKERYATFPCCGTGKIGDANLSVYLSDDIVRKFHLLLAVV